MRKKTELLGQPLGLRTLFLTEFWERFSYYGMRAILLFYMYYSIEKGGLGIDQTTAASIMSIYGAMVYMTGVVGGFISDRILGPRRTVFWGGVLDHVRTHCSIIAYWDDRIIWIDCFDHTWYWFIETKCFRHGRNAIFR